MSQASQSLPLVLLGVVVFQALLGMWTVTWQLKPVVVMAHLLGGLTTLRACWPGWCYGKVTTGS